MQTQTSQTRHGVMTYPPHDRFVGRALALYGEYSEHECGLLEQLVGAGDVVVEAGANLGAHTVFLARRVGPKGRVYAFEPQAPIHELLDRNLRDNDLAPPAVALYAALGSRMGVARIPRIDYDAAGQNFGGCALTDAADGVEVQMLTVDSLGLMRCDLIKVDVEGHEAQVIEGARETIARCRPLLYVENDREDRSAALMELLLSLGYHCYWHLPPLYNPRNLRGNPHNAFPGILSINLLCVPAERPAEIPLQPVSGPAARWQEGMQVTVRQTPPAPGQKTVAVVRPGAYGDALMASSVLPALKRDGWHVTVYTESKGAEVLRHDPHVDRLLVTDDANVPVETIDWYWSTQRDLYDRWINLTETVEKNALAVPTDLAFHWPDEARRARFGGHNYVELMHRVAGVPYVGPEVVFYPTTEEIRRAEDYRASLGPGPVVALAPVGSTVSKDWPHAPAFAVHMADAGCTVVVLGDTRAREYAPHPRIRVIGTAWPIRDALAFVQCADLVVGQETGLLNAVSMTRQPKIVLLSHSTNHNLTRDWVNTLALSPAGLDCYPCHRVHLMQLGFRDCNRDDATGAAACQAGYGAADVAERALNMLRARFEEAA